MVRDSTPLQFRTKDLAEALDTRAKLKRPVIVEGILLPRALDEIDRTPDFLIFVHRASNRSSLPTLTHTYLHEFAPRQKADKIVSWSSLKRDRRIVRAHQERR
jgi:hypothetical protein